MPTLRTAGIEFRISTAGAASAQRQFAGIAGAIVGSAGRARNAVGGIFAGVLLARGLREAVDVIAQFEQQMRILQGVTRSGEAVLAVFEDRARTLGATTRFTSTQVAEGMVLLARAGFTAGEVIEAVGSTLLLAQSSQISLARATDITSNAIRQFGLAASESVRVTDALTIAANRTNTNVDQMGEALKFAGTQAGVMGLSIEDTAALIGILGDVGIRASLAGTNLRSSLLRLSAPSDVGRIALERLGIQVEKLNPEFQDVADILDRLVPLLADASARVDVFTLRNVSAATALIFLREKFKFLREEMRSASGETENIARLMDQTLVGSFFALSSSMQELILQFGDAGFRGALFDFVNSTTDALRLMAGFGDRLLGSREDAEKFRSALGALAGATGMLAVVSASRLLVRAITALSVALAKSPITAGLIGIGAIIGEILAHQDEIVEIGGRQVRVGDLIREMFTATAETATDAAESTDELSRGVRSLADEYKALKDTADLTTMRLPFGDPRIEEQRKQVEALRAEMDGLFEESRGAPVDLGTGGLIGDLQATAEAYAELQAQVDRTRQAFGEPHDPSGDAFLTFTENVNALQAQMKELALQYTETRATIESQALFPPEYLSDVERSLEKLLGVLPPIVSQEDVDNAESVADALGGVGGMLGDYVRDTLAGIVEITGMVAESGRDFSLGALEWLAGAEGFEGAVTRASAALKTDAKDLDAILERMQLPEIPESLDIKDVDLITGEQIGLLDDARDRIADIFEITQSGVAVQQQLEALRSSSLLAESERQAINLEALATSLEERGVEQDLTKLQEVQIGLGLLAAENQLKIVSGRQEEAKLVTELLRDVERLAQVSQEFGDAVGQGVEEAIVGEAKLRDIGEQVARDIQRLLVRAFIVRPIVEEAEQAFAGIFDSSFGVTEARLEKAGIVLNNAIISGLDAASLRLELAAKRVRGASGIDPAREAGAPATPSLVEGIFDEADPAVDATIKAQAAAGALREAAAELQTSVVNAAAGAGEVVTTSVTNLAGVTTTAAGEIAGAAASAVGGANLAVAEAASNFALVIVSALNGATLRIEIATKELLAAAAVAAGTKVASSGGGDTSGTGGPKQHGGVIFQSSFLPIGRGYVPVAEAEPEGILPLRRTKEGRLGVEASGTGGARTTNVWMTVQTKDADSFMRSERQIMRRVQDSARNAR